MRDSIRAFEEHNAEQQRKNQDQLLRTQTMEAREHEIQKKIKALRSSHVPTEARVPMNTFQPFSEEIQTVVVPQHFREPVIMAYNSSGDPKDHVTAFETQMFISSGDNTIICKMFLGTLKDVALRWFIRLSLRSVTNFGDLTRRFTAQLSTIQGKQIVLFDLLYFHQG